MRLKLRTRVTIAQSIITKVKRSSYVTIGTSLLPKCPAADIIAPSAPWVNILYAVVKVQKNYGQMGPFCHKIKAKQRERWNTI